MDSPKSRRVGTGLVVDTVRGLVVVGKNIVPFALGELNITIADSLIIPGIVVFVHPTQNFCLVKYDPFLVGNTDLRAAPLADSVDLTQGKQVKLIALNHSHRPIVLETRITDSSPVTIPVSPSPRFRAINFESITIDTSIGQQCSSGVLIDTKVQALWLSFLGERNQQNADLEYHLGLSVDVLKPLLANFPIKKLRGFGAEFTPMPISQARNMGVPDYLISKLEKSVKGPRHFFVVSRVADASICLKELDIVLSINEELATCISQFDLATDLLEVVKISVFRHKTIVELQVSTLEMDTIGTRRVLQWAGALIQEPHFAAKLQSRNLPSEIYISARSKGSPAYSFGINPTQSITHVNGIAVKTLDDFIRETRHLKNSYVRLRVVSFDSVPTVISVKLNLHYWPTRLYERLETGEWIKK